MRHAIELLQAEFEHVSRTLEDESIQWQQYQNAQAVLDDLELAINALILLESQLKENEK